MFSRLDKNTKVFALCGAIIVRHGRHGVCGGADL
jgi:hypothetical protein